MSVKSQTDLYGEAHEALAAYDGAKDEFRSKFLDENGAPKADADQKEFDAGAANLRELEAKHRQLMEAAKLAPKDAEQRANEADSVESNAFLRYMAEGAEGLSADEWKAHRLEGVKGRAAMAFVPSAEQLAALDPKMAFSSPARTDLPSGVHPVITETDVYRTLRYFGGIKEACAFRSVETGAERNVPMLSSHTQTGRRLVAEGTTATDTDLPNYTHTAIKPFTYSSDTMVFSLESLQDAVIDITRDVMIELPRRIGRIQNTEFTNTPTAGGASTKPQGLVDFASNTQDFATASALVWTDLEAARDALDVSYLMGRETNMGMGYSVTNQVKVCWMMHQNVWSAIRRLQDTTNRPLLLQEAQSGIAGVFPNTLLGYPVVLNNDMPDTSSAAADRVFALFGDMGAYRVTEVGGSFAVLRLYGDTYARNNQVAYLAFHRATGNGVGPGESIVKLTR